MDLAPSESTMQSQFGKGRFMDKWEYKFIDLKVKIWSGTSQTEVALNELGKEGWEAVGFGEASGIFIIMLKRKLA